MAKTLALKRSLCRLLFSAGLLLSAAVVADDSLNSLEPASRADFGWDIRRPPGSGWLPDSVSNRAGTFIRLGSHIVLLEGLSAEVLASIRISFQYGGVAPASALGVTYLLLLSVGAAESAGLSAIGRPFLYLASSVGLLVALNSWGWQIKNFWDNGLSSGSTNILANTVAGVESHYYGVSTFQQAQRTGCRITPRPVNANRLIIPAFQLAHWGSGLFYNQLSGNMFDSLEVALPPTLVERAFVNLAIAGEAPELRIHRIPKAMREDRFDHLQASASPWHSLLQIMDRDRIDRLTIEPQQRHGKVALKVTLLDYRSPKPSTIMVETHIPAGDVLWLEGMLVGGQGRQAESNRQSLLHPDYMVMISQALHCFRAFDSHEAFRHCGENMLMQANEKKRYFRWILPEKSSDTPLVWEIEKIDRTLFYFEKPRSEEIAFLTWHDGPQLELRDGTYLETSALYHYHIGEQAGFALAGELDYLARYLPHALFSLVMVPTLQGLSSSSRFPVPTQQALDSLELMGHNYAPGWMTNFDALIKMMQKIHHSDGRVW